MVESRLSSAETSFREMDDVFLQTQTRIWLAEVLHVVFEDDATVADLLVDGELLFHLSKVMWKKLVSHSMEAIKSEVMIYERTSYAKNNERYMAYPKIDSFLKICQILGLTGIDLFCPSDVVEKRNTRRVCMCIRSLSKKARLKGLNVPDFDIVTYTIAMPKDMVGDICRNLEQSQIAYQSPKAVRYFRGRAIHVQPYTVDGEGYPDLQEMERTPKEFQFLSPESDKSSSITSFGSGSSHGSNSSSLSSISTAESSFTSDGYQDELHYSGKMEQCSSSESTNHANPCSSSNYIHSNLKIQSSPSGNVHWLLDSPQADNYLQKDEFKSSQTHSLCSGNLSNQLNFLVDKNKENSGVILQKNFGCEGETHSCSLERLEDGSSWETAPSRDMSCITEDGQSIISGHSSPRVEDPNESGISDLESEDGESQCSNAVHSPVIVSRQWSPNYPMTFPDFHAENYFEGWQSTPDTCSPCIISWDLRESSCSPSINAAAAKTGTGICIEGLGEHDLQKPDSMVHTDNGTLVDDLSDITFLLTSDHVLEQGYRHKFGLTKGRSEKKSKKDQGKSYGRYSSQGRMFQEGCMPWEMDLGGGYFLGSITNNSLCADLYHQKFSGISVNDPRNRQISSYGIWDSIFCENVEGAEEESLKGDLVRKQVVLRPGSMDRCTEVDTPLFTVQRKSGDHCGDSDPLGIYEKIQSDASHNAVHLLYDLAEITRNVSVASDGIGTKSVMAVDQSPCINTPLDENTGSPCKVSAQESDQYHLSSMDANILDASCGNDREIRDQFGLKTPSVFLAKTTAYTDEQVMNKKKTNDESSTIPLCCNSKSEMLLLGTDTCYPEVSTKATGLQNNPILVSTGDLSSHPAPTLAYPDRMYSVQESPTEGDSIDANSAVEKEVASELGSAVPDDPNPENMNMDVERCVKTDAGFASANGQEKSTSRAKNQGHKAMLLKSIASGITLVGGALLLLHLRRPEGSNDIFTSIRGSRMAKESQKDSTKKAVEAQRSSAAHPASYLKF